MIKNTTYTQSRLSKSTAKQINSRNTLNQFKNIEKEEESKVNQQSVKKMSQYEALAIKLGLMPKKAKSSKPHLQQQSRKIDKTSTTKTQSDFSTQNSKITQKQNSKFFTNKAHQSFTPHPSSQCRQFQNPYTSLHNNYVAQSSVNCLENKLELENIYKKYLSESQINIQPQNEIPKQEEIMNREMIRTQKNISKLQVHLNLLINKYSKEI